MLFKEWLAKYRNENNSFGEFVRKAINIRNFPNSENKTYILKRLKSISDLDMETLKYAYTRYIYETENNIYLHSKYLLN